MVNEELILMALVATTVVALGWLQWQRLRLEAAAANERNRLLREISARFGDAPEFVEFARSRAGRVLLDDGQSVAATKRRLLSQLQFAVLALALAAGFLINGTAPPVGADLNLVREADHARWWGTILGCAGTGLLVAAIGNTWLARRWGMLDD